MKKLIYILSLSILTALMWSCRDEIDVNKGVNTDTSSIGSVEVLEDGRLRVSGLLSDVAMSTVTVSSRAASAEENLVDGWCLLFAEDEKYRAMSDSSTYTVNSPLLLKEKLTINANGTFFVTLPCYEGVAFLRVVVNLTDRENKNLASAKAWGDDEENYSSIGELLWLNALPDTDSELSGIGLFGDYIYQSVGLDGIYNISGGYSTVTTGNYVTDVNGVESLEYDSINTTPPDPNDDLRSAFPMSSVGFVLEDVTVESLADMFGTTIYLVRVCSKVQVAVSDDLFTLKEVYMIDCAQEARIRSTVLSESSTLGSTVSSSTFGVPVDLGDSITYLPLQEVVTTGGTTSPIYIYPNSGGDYNSNNGAVNQKVNPQYVVVKGRAEGYDTDGYYKVALKAQYPMEYQYESDGTTLSTDGEGNYIVTKYSDLIYDILRNTHFIVDLKMVDKPGYKTFEDASNPDNPASNISYSISILSSDSRNEILVSNGSYYVELNTTRVYMKGYGEDGTSGSITFSVHPNDAVDSDGVSYGYYHPALYVMADYYVNINSCYVDYNDNINSDGVVKPTNLDGTIYADEADDTDNYVHDYWVKVEESNSSTQVTVNFTATNSGRIRLRLGDMLKFIPVMYESDAFTGAADTIAIGYETDFSYDKITYLTTNTNADIFDAVDNSTYDWFTSKGEITDNLSGAEREMRAMIYPSMADGITKLYFMQEIYKSSVTNKDDYDPGQDTVLKDGNVVFLDGVNGTKYSNAADAASDILRMLEEGYTTIYFEGDWDSMSIEDILTAVNNQTDALFAVNLLYVDGFDYDFKDGYADIFDNNTNITSVVLPSSIGKIDESSFIGCTNLKEIIVGAIDDPSECCIIIKDAFVNCPSLETIIVYSTEKEVKLESQSGTSSYLKSETTLPKDDSSRRKAIVNASKTSYFYIFGNTASYTDAGGDYYEYLYTN